jgi:hypothetical protein
MIAMICSSVRSPVSTLFEDKTTRKGVTGRFA